MVLTVSNVKNHISGRFVLRVVDFNDKYEIIRRKDIFDGVSKDLPIEFHDYHVLTMFPYNSYTTIITVLDDKKSR